MANIIKPKRSTVAGKVPTTSDLTNGEIAINSTDKKIYTNAGGTITQVGAGALTALSDTNISAPSNGEALKYDSASGKWVNSAAGAGDVTGAASSTDNAVVRFDGTTGKVIQNSTVTLDDNGNFANVNAIGFDTTPGTLPTAAGSMFWDSGDGTPSIILNANTSLQLGQENIALVYNGTGSTIAKGSVVAVSGAQGQRPSVVLADADSEALSAPTLGVTAEAIANGAEGFVCTFGLVRGIDTSAFTAGVPIYLSQTAGAFTATRPSAPAHTVALGWVIKSNASSGEIFININNGWELDELHNVLISSPASGNTLIYDASVGVWKNANLTDGTGITITEGAGSITITNSGVTSAVAGTGISVSGATGAVTITNSDRGSSQNIFKNIAVAGQSTVVADSNDDTLTFAAGTGITITTNATTDTVTITGTGGTVTSVGMTVPTGLSVSGSPITSSGTLAITYAAGYSIPTTTSQTNWDTAYTDRLKWDGGSTGLVAATGRTSLGATTLGSNLFTITNPSAITFPRFNADNTVSALDAATFRSAIGAGTGSGTVTSVATGTGLTGGTITSTGTISLANTAVTAGSYTLASITVDAQGRITAASNGTVSVTPAAVSDQTNTSTGYFDVPTGTTAQRPGTPFAGALRYNSTTGYYEAGFGTLWRNLVDSRIVATGGTITYSGGYTIHTFTSSGTFTVLSGSGTVECLIVAGGGGAGGGNSGCHGGGGGGAGGIVYRAAESVLVGSYAVTVGGGGAPSGGDGQYGANGGNSTFLGLTALGGGGGGATLTANGLNGGSGGGASRDKTYNAGGTGLQPGSASGGYGNNGGGTGSSTSAGGGGGAGGAGQSGTDGARGGIGLQFTQFGTSVYYGGGGNGAGQSDSTLGRTPTGQSGAANTGAGGGGAPGGATRGSGGSGIVIVRYPT